MNQTNQDQNNSKVVTYILGSIDTSISLSLQSYNKASDMWSRLQSLYHQANKARKYFLDYEIAKYTEGDKSNQDYYSGFLTLWNERDFMMLETGKPESRADVLKIQEESHISQFLMNLQLEFESVRSALLNREVYPDLKTCSRSSTGRSKGLFRPTIIKSYSSDF